MLQLALERTRTQLYSAVLSRTHVGSQLLVFTRCSEYTAHRRTPALTLAYSFTSLATTAPPTGLCPHWIRYPGGMVHVGVKTNIPFILNVLKHPDFVSGHATTSFIGDNPQLLDFTDARDRGQKQYLESSSPRVKAQLLEMQINLSGCSTTLAR